jgi:polysaccharide export outer membrane protein
MKRLFIAIIAVFAWGLATANAQNAASPAKENQAPPAVVLPPVIVPVSGPKTSATPETEAGADKNHSSAAAAPKPAAPLPLTETYRIGPGDILDIRLLNFASRQSSLFTVQADGKLAYSYLNEPVIVVGLTAEETAARLNALIKVFDQPQTVVTVRHFASHTVTIAGLAAKAGPLALRREAVPFFTLLPLIQPLPEAQRAVIERNGKPVREIALDNAQEAEFLLEAGDQINFLTAPPVAPVKKEYFFIIGTVNTPGQKEFHQGLTLTQAIFAAGGLSKGKEGKARLLRQTADGRLAATEYNLKRIGQGKDPDPTLEAGDRLEVFGKD